MFPQVLIWLAYLASMPLLFVGWAALEIAAHPEKYS